MEGQGLRNWLLEVLPHMFTNYRLGIDDQAALGMASELYSRRSRHIKLRALR